MSQAGQSMARRAASRPRILYLSLNPNLNGPLPKIDPLLISALTHLGCLITKGTWGRHAEGETVVQKVFSRVNDLLQALLRLASGRYNILYIATTLDEKALARDVPLLLAARWFPAKKVLIEHGSKVTLFTSKGDRLYKTLSRWVIRLSDAVLLLSNEEMQAWTEFEPCGRYYRVDNPFDPSAAKQALRDPAAGKGDGKHPILLFAGRLIQEKGIFDLLEAMPRILQHIDCQLLVAGMGEARGEIQQIIAKANLQAHVTLLGYLDTDSLADLYCTATMFILPTYFGEGFPTVITEAMSYGLPIVTTPIRGTKDHLRDGIHALFVPPHDPPAIASAVLRLLADPQAQQEMGRANLARVQEFRPEILAPKYLALFQEILGSQRSGGSWLSRNGLPDKKSQGRFPYGRVPD